MRTMLLLVAGAALIAMTGAASIETDGATSIEMDGEKYLEATDEILESLNLKHPYSENQFYAELYGYDLDRIELTVNQGSNYVEEEGENKELILSAVNQPEENTSYDVICQDFLGIYLESPGEVPGGRLCNLDFIKFELKTHNSEKYIVATLHFNLKDEYISRVEIPILQKPFKLPALFDSDYELWANENQIVLEHLFNPEQLDALVYEDEQEITLNLNRLSILLEHGLWPKGLLEYYEDSDISDGCVEVKVYQSRPIALTENEMEDMIELITEKSATKVQKSNTTQ